MVENEVVWLHTERIYAVLVRRDAFFSIVRYTSGGIDYEVQVENDDYDIFEERATEFESDE